MSAAYGYVSLVDGHFHRYKKPKKFTINAADREGFVQNDEGLYRAQRSSGLSVRAFIAENKEDIDRAIRSATGN